MDSRWLHRSAVLFCLSVLIALAGCGGEGRVQVSGKVTHNGEAVSGGTIVFSPKSAGATKAATAEVGEDGAYVLGTNTPKDGALIGQYKVTYTPPEAKLTEEQRKDPKYHAPASKYLGLTPKQEDVEVKAGGSTIEIELISPKKK